MEALQLMDPQNTLSLGSAGFTLFLHKFLLSVSSPKWGSITLQWTSGNTLGLSGTLLPGEKMLSFAFSILSSSP